MAEEVIQPTAEEFASIESKCAVLAMGGAMGCASQGWSAVTVRLGWTPGDPAPAFCEVESVDSLGLTHPIPASALLPEDWFSIDSIASDLRLASLVRRKRVLDGYFFEKNGECPWSKQVLSK